MKTIFICGLGQAEEDYLGVKESSLFFKESPILSFNKQLAKPIDYPTLYRYFEKGISKSALLGLLASMTKLNFEKDLKKIVCPCPILYGERDEANKKAAKELSEKLSNAKLKMMKHPGHQVNVDHPLELSKMAEKFLKNPVFF